MHPRVALYALSAVLALTLLPLSADAKKCKAKSVSKSSSSSSSKHHHHHHHSSSKKKHHHKSSSTKKKHHKHKSSSSRTTVGGSASGGVTTSGSVSASEAIAKVKSSCGSADPSDDVSVAGGPNGKQSWLNCGVSGKGWDPPMVTMDMLSILDLQSAGGLYSRCSKYTSLFEKWGKAYSVPPIFLAAFAMQESSCNADVLGDDGGAYGLMQITSDKCGGAPGGNCNDPSFNIQMGAKTFADGLADANGNVLVAIGSYNGWYTGLTFAEATAARYTGCCVCQNNLDYLQQFLNGWILGVNPYSKKLGSIDNLAVCGPDQ